ncbi:unnamed protein product [Amoebophrya sp. A25]|nr:unnamed protein product [Amoebophrya sp. A25]|eukprot:GSA25T00008084001.1
MNGRISDGMLVVKNTFLDVAKLPDDIPRSVTEPIQRARTQQCQSRDIMVSHTSIPESDAEYIGNLLYTTTDAIDRGVSRRSLASSELSAASPERMVTWDEYKPAQGYDNRWQKDLRKACSGPADDSGSYSRQTAQPKDGYHHQPTLSYSGDDTERTPIGYGRQYNYPVEGVVGQHGSFSSREFATGTGYYQHLAASSNSTMLVGERTASRLAPSPPPPGLGNGVGPQHSSACINLAGGMPGVVVGGRDHPRSRADHPLGVPTVVKANYYYNNTQCCTFLRSIFMIPAVLKGKETRAKGFDGSCNITTIFTSNYCGSCNIPCGSRGGGPRLGASFVEQQRHQQEQLVKELMAHSASTTKEAPGGVDCSREGGLVSVPAYALSKLLEQVRDIGAGGVSGVVSASNSRGGASGGATSTNHGGLRGGGLGGNNNGVAGGIGRGQGFNHQNCVQNGGSRGDAVTPGSMSSPGTVQSRFLGSSGGGGPGTGNTTPYGDLQGMGGPQGGGLQNPLHGALGLDMSALQAAPGSSLVDGNGGVSSFSSSRAVLSPSSQQFATSLFNPYTGAFPGAAGMGVGAAFPPTASLYNHLGTGGGGGTSASTSCNHHTPGGATTAGLLGATAEPAVRLVGYNGGAGGQYNGQYNAMAGGYLPSALPSALPPNDNGSDAPSGHFGFAPTLPMVRGPGMYGGAANGAVANGGTVDPSNSFHLPGEQAQLDHNNGETSGKSRACNKGSSSAGYNNNHRVEVGGGAGANNHQVDLMFGAGSNVAAVGGGAPPSNTAILQQHRSSSGVLASREQSRGSVFPMDANAVANIMMNNLQKQTIASSISSSCGAGQAGHHHAGFYRPPQRGGGDSSVYGSYNAPPGSNGRYGENNPTSNTTPTGATNAHARQLFAHLRAEGEDRGGEEPPILSVGKGGKNSSWRQQQVVDPFGGVKTLQGPAKGGKNHEGQQNRNEGNGRWGDSDYTINMSSKGNNNYQQKAPVYNNNERPVGGSRYDSVLGQKKRVYDGMPGTNNGQNIKVQNNNKRRGRKNNVEAGAALANGSTPRQHTARQQTGGSTSNVGNNNNQTNSNISNGGSAGTRQQNGNKNNKQNNGNEGNGGNSTSTADNDAKQNKQHNGKGSSGKDSSVTRQRISERCTTSGGKTDGSSLGGRSSTLVEDGFSPQGAEGENNKAAPGSGKASDHSGPPSAQGDGDGANKLDSDINAIQEASASKAVPSSSRTPSKEYNFTTKPSLVPHSIPATPHSLVRQVSCTTGAHRVVWNVEGKRLKSTDKLCVSPAFSLGGLESVKYRIVLYPQEASTFKGQGNFRTSKGKGKIVLKCDSADTDVKAGEEVAFQLVFRFFLGDLSGNPSLSKPVRNDFTALPTAGLRKMDEIWDFGKSVSKGTLIVGVEVISGSAAPTPESWLSPGGENELKKVPSTEADSCKTDEGRAAKDEDTTKKSEQAANEVVDELDAASVAEDKDTKEQRWEDQAVTIANGTASPTA